MITSDHHFHKFLVFVKQILLRKYERYYIHFYFLVCIVWDTVCKRIDLEILMDLHAFSSPKWFQECYLYVCVCAHLCASLAPERLTSFYSCSVFIGQCSVTGYIAPKIGANHKIVFFSKNGCNYVFWLSCGNLLSLYS